MIQQFHFRIHTQKNWKQDLQEIFVRECSLHHHSQQPKARRNPNVHQQMNKQMCYIHIIQYYSALKKKQILTPTTTRMDPEDIMLSDMNQAQNGRYC